MEEEMYIKLKHQLQSIKYKYEKLDDCYSELSALLKRNCLVNDKVIEKSLLLSIHKNQRNVKNEIDNVLIPQVNKSIKS